MAVETFRPTAWLRPLLATRALAGLRIGEARGLSWARVEAEHLQVREGVDRFAVRDTVRTATALRSVPVGPQLSMILANWSTKTAGEGGLVFTSETGTPIGYPTIVNGQLGPLPVALDIVAADGFPRQTAHSFPHFAVSLWIDEGAKIGQVSDQAGQKAPEFTQGIYGHHFHAGRTDRRAVTAGELSVLGAIEPAIPTQHGTDNALGNGASAIAQSTASAAF